MSKSQSKSQNKNHGKRSTHRKVEPFEDPARNEIHRWIVAFIEGELQREHGERIEIELIHLDPDPDVICESIRSWYVGSNEVDGAGAVGKAAAEILREASLAARAGSRYRLIAEDRLGQQRQIEFHAPGDPRIPHQKDPPGEPFILKIDGAGVHVDVRVEGTRSLAKILGTIRSGVNDALAPAIPAIVAGLRRHFEDSDLPGQSTTEESNGLEDRDISRMAESEMDDLLRSIQAERDHRTETHRRIVTFLEAEFSRTEERRCVSVELLVAQPSMRLDGQVGVAALGTWGSVHIESLTPTAMADEIAKISEGHAESYVGGSHRYEIRTRQHLGGQQRFAFRIFAMADMEQILKSIQSERDRRAEMRS